MATDPSERCPRSSFSLTLDSTKILEWTEISNGGRMTRTAADGRSGRRRYDVLRRRHYVRGTHRRCLVPSPRLALPPPPLLIALRSPLTKVERRGSRLHSRGGKEGHSHFHKYNPQELKSRLSFFEGLGWMRLFIRSLMHASMEVMYIY